MTMLTSIDEYVEQYVRIQRTDRQDEGREPAVGTARPEFLDIERLPEIYIFNPPSRPAIEDAVLKDCGAPVWSIVSYLIAFDGDMELIARYFETSLESVLAAVVYYSRHQAEIDQRIRANESVFKNA
jgi:uncharacterized protein (DUF433 family)